jgi:hypothetical protein
MELLNSTYSSRPSVSPPPPSPLHTFDPRFFCMCVSVLEGPLNPLPLPAGCDEAAAPLAHRQCLLPTAGRPLAGSSSGTSGGKWKAKPKPKASEPPSGGLPSEGAFEDNPVRPSPPPPPDPKGITEGGGLLAKMVLA